MRSHLRITSALLLGALSLVRPPARAGEPGSEPPGVPPQTIPRERLHVEAAKIRGKLEGILKRLADDSWRVREKASEELVALGPKAVPLVAAHVTHRDPEVAMRVQRALPRMKGGAGDVLEGLMLSAALVGRKPRRGEAVPLWLTITNTTSEEVHIFQYFWELVLQPKEKKTSDHARTVGATTPATLTAQDFLCIKPGQSVGYLMDADPLEGAAGAPAVRAYLEISLPDSARNIIKGKVFSGSLELVSGPIEMTYADDAAAPDPQAAALVEDFLAGRAGAEDALKPVQKDGGAAALALRAIRNGLRRGKADERWKVFEFVWRNPHPSLEDDVVGFLGRYGPRLKQESAMLPGLKAFQAGLPPERRLVFLHRAALAMLHDWRSVSSLASDYTASSDPAERALALKLFMLLYERGDRRPEVMNWLAMEFHYSADPKLRDPEKARKFAELAVRGEPESRRYQLTLACLSGDKEKTAALARAARTPGELNGIAWDLTTRFPAGSWQSKLALEIGIKALEGVKPEDKEYRFILDTVAVCYAATGNYTRALELEEQAFEKHRPGDGFQKDYAERIARFTALIRAEEAERPGMATEPPKLRFRGARDALLERLRAEKHAMIRAEIVRLLRACYGRDAAVRKALGETDAEPPAAAPDETGAGGRASQTPRNGRRTPP